jgi:hypothetical protein
MSMSFLVDLRPDAWNEQLRGWSCPVLKIPGAEIDDLYASSHRVDSTWYTAETNIGMVQWVHDDQPPASSTAQLTLTKDLEDQDISIFWKKLAIILPLVFSLAAAVITAWAKSQPPPSPPPLPQMSTFDIYHVTGTLALGGLPPSQLVTQFQPPNIAINDDGYFQFDLPIETRRDGARIAPTLLFFSLDPKYRTTVVHLSEGASSLNVHDFGLHYREHPNIIELTRPIPIERAPNGP